MKKLKLTKNKSLSKKILLSIALASIIGIGFISYNRSNINYNKLKGEVISEVKVYPGVIKKIKAENVTVTSKEKSNKSYTLEKFFDVYLGGKIMQNFEVTDDYIYASYKAKNYKNKKTSERLLSSYENNATTTINNLAQYTDIAIFINNSNNEFTLENTLKSVSIKDISFNTLPSLGTPNIYYKSLTDFATPNVLEDNLLDSELDFSTSAEDEIDYNKPILFNNCANPITLSYVNSNIKNDYTLSNENSSIAYDGSLLKKCNVLLNDLNCSLSFTIYIENNLGEKFKCPVYINIPLDNQSTSIYDGSYTYIYNPNYYFYKYD